MITLRDIEHLFKKEATRRFIPIGIREGNNIRWIITINLNEIETSNDYLDYEIDEIRGLSWEGDIEIILKNIEME